MSLMKQGVILACVLVGACSPSPSPVKAPEAREPEIDGLVGIRLGSTLDARPCPSNTPRADELPCIKNQGAAFGTTVVLPESSVPRQTRNEVDLGLIDGRIGSIRLETSLSPEKAVKMLVEKWGAANGPEDPNAVRWQSATAEALFFLDAVEPDEHMILVQSRDYTAHQRLQERAADEAAGKF